MCGGGQGRYDAIDGSTAHHANSRAHNLLSVCVYRAKAVYNWIGFLTIGFSHVELTLVQVSTKGSEACKT